MILATKLLPPKPRQNTLFRTRLLSILNDNLKKRLILICAAAGYGKTTLLATLAAQVRKTVVWYNLDNDDRDLGIFLYHLIYALRQSHADFGEKTQAVLELGDPIKNFNFLARTLINELFEIIKADIYIIFDDYHNVENTRGINHLLEFMLEHLPPNIHIIISSRNYPPFSLARLRATAELYEIHTPELKFTLEEVADIYQPVLSPRNLQDAWEYFEGWITGIQCFVHLFGQNYPASLNLSEEETFNYFAAEVLDQQPEPVRSFLIHSSILDWLTPEICNSVLGIKDGARHLNYLMDKNLFIDQLIDRKKYYRYHRLFREFLMTRLEAEGRTKINDLYRRAARFYEDRNDMTFAINYYLAAHDKETAAHLIIKNCRRDIMARGGSGRLEGWLNQFPEGLITSKPWLLFIRASILMDKGSWDESFDAYQQADQVFSQKKDRLGMCLATYRMSVLLKRRGDQNNALRLGKKSLKLVPAREKELKALIINAICTLDITRAQYRNLGPRLHRALNLVKGKSSRPEAIILTNLGLVSQIIGDFAGAIENYEQAIKLGEKVILPGISIIYNNLATVKMLTGRFDEAKILLEKSKDYADTYNDQRALLTTYTAYSEFYLLQHEYDRFDETIKKANELNQPMKEKEAELLINLLLARRKAEVGDYRSSRSHFERARQEKEAGFLSVQALLGLGELELTDGNLTKARRLFNQGLETAQRLGMNYFITMAYLDLAQLYHQRKETKRALGYLSLTLDLARKNNYDYLIITRARSGALRLLIDGLKHSVTSEYITQVLTAGDIGMVLQLMAEKDAKARDAAQKIFLKLSAQRGYHLKIYTSHRLQMLISPEREFITRWHSHKQKSLFEFFATHPGSHHKEKLVELFWPDQAPSRALQNLRSTIAHLNQQFPFLPHLIVRLDQDYGINDKYRIPVDAIEFHNMVSEGKAGEHFHQQKAVEKYETALSIYPNDFLSDNYDNWVEEYRDHLGRTYCTILHYLIEYDSRADKPQESINHLLSVIRLEPFIEENYQKLFRAYGQSGNKKAVEDAYARMCRLFSKELGREPSVETVLLYQNLMNQP